MAKYLKIPEVARRLDVSEKTARRYVKAGALPSTFIGGAYRVTEEDLEEFVHQAEVKPEVPKAQAPLPREEQTYGEVLEARGFPSEQVAAALAQDERDKEFIRRELEKMSPKDILEALIASPGMRKVRDYYREQEAKTEEPPRSETA